MCMPEPVGGPFCRCCVCRHVHCLVDHPGHHHSTRVDPFELLIRAHLKTHPPPSPPVCAHGHTTLTVGCVSCALVWDRHDTASRYAELDRVKG